MKNRKGTYSLILFYAVYWNPFWWLVVFFGILIIAACFIGNDGYTKDMYKQDLLTLLRGLSWY